MLKWNKKGFLDDTLDLLAIVVVPIFGLLFLGLVLNQNIIDSHKASAESVHDFKRLDSATSNLLVQIQAGEEIDPKKIDKLIKESKTPGGKTITDCSDYWAKEDCNNDLVKIKVEDDRHRCGWNEALQKCQSQFVGR